MTAAGFASSGVKAIRSKWTTIKDVMSKRKDRLDPVHPGAKQPQSHRTVGRSRSPDSWKIRRLSAADGCRGRQESNGFLLVWFINASFEFVFNLLQAVPITAGRRIGGNIQQPADFLKSAAVPYF